MIHSPLDDFDETWSGSMCCRRVGVVLFCGIDLSASRRRKRTKQFFGLRRREAYAPTLLGEDEVLGILCEGCPIIKYGPRRCAGVVRRRRLAD